MDNKCARCEKTVYPIEELKCLDKRWHKQCFKCQSCGMTLNMRNYKGFNKDPYCEAHVPKAKATVVAETPEFKRIAENTKLQSNVKYHADFEKTKGRLTQVADDPETLRLKQNSQIQSNVAYHGDLKKKAEMEQQRLILTSEYISNEFPINEGSSGVGASHSNHIVLPSVESYPNMNVSENSVISQNTSYSRQAPTLIYSSNETANKNPVVSIGSIDDLDPVNDFYGSLNHSTTNSNYENRAAHNRYHHNHQQQQPELNKTSQLNNDPPSNYSFYDGCNKVKSMPQRDLSSGSIYRAMYDYDARESDEVSFIDGDIIVNCVPIHEGWMSGVVKRTGLRGLLPANYIESVVI